MDGAAAAGYLEMVMWLHEYGASCTTDAMDLAAEEGRLDIVQVRRKFKFYYFIIFACCVD